jgi:hypothetical protein
MDAPMDAPDNVVASIPQFFDIWLQPSNLVATNIWTWTHPDGTKQKNGYTHRTVDVSIRDQTTVWMQPPNLWTWAHFSQTT